MSKYGVFSSPYLDTFHAMSVGSNKLFEQIILIKFIHQQWNQLTTFFFRDAEFNTS